MLSLVALSVAYLTCLPYTVQTGDTGGLVTAAFTMSWDGSAAGPSVYGVVLSAFLKMLMGGEIFWRAAVFNALLAMACIAVAIWPRAQNKRSMFASVVVALSLGLSVAFWRQALLPNVFSLQALLMSALVGVFLHSNAKRRPHLLGGLFVLAVGNHFSGLLALPLLLDEAWLGRRSNNRAHLVMLILSALGVCALVLGMLPKPEPVDLELSARLEPLALLLTRDLLPLVALAIMGGLFCARESAYRHRAAIAALIGLVTLVPVLQLAMGGPQFATLTERFLMVPLGLAATLAFSLVSRTELLSRGRSVALALLLLAVATVSLARAAIYRNEVNFSRDTIVEDYAVNLLNMASNPAKSIFVVEGATRLNALLYAQKVLGVKEEAIVLSAAEAASPEAMARIQAGHPDFLYAHSGPRTITRMLVDPNLGKYSVFFTRNFQLDNYHVTYHALGRVPERGMRSIGFNSESWKQINLRTTADSLHPSLEYNERHDLFSEYAYYDLALGMFHYGKADPMASKAALEKALERVPYCIPAYKNLCSLAKAVKAKQLNRCYERVEMLEASWFNYY